MSESEAGRAARRPNVVVIVLDDTGFAQLGCFGSDVSTPHIDALAARGLRYNRFHVTALCSPTRACVLTGMNHHAVGMGVVPDFPTDTPGYSGRVPRSAAMLPRVLQEAGYNTFALGKWHLVPRGEEGGAGPFGSWPLGRGFDRYYGFLRGHTNQLTPDLVSDNHTVDLPRTPSHVPRSLEDPPGSAGAYHLSEDLVDNAMRMILDQQHAAPGKPFFTYVGFGATHTPFHVAPEWVEPYAGRFDDGWERWRERTFDRQVAAGIVPGGTVLTARPPWVPAWADLGADARRVAARMQEVFAGFLSHTDAQVGRLAAFLDELGVLDDTIVMLLSDNGASSEGGSRGAVNSQLRLQRGAATTQDNVAQLHEFGGPRSYGLYPWGWAWAGNTPFRLWKSFTWLGGTRTPLIVSWPRGIRAAGEVRQQFCHAVDLMPTILDALEVERPDEIDGVAQRPMDGRSLLQTFDDAAAPAPRGTQYFEMVGSRSIVHGPWKATTDYVRTPAVGDLPLEGSHTLDADRWELFRLDEDFSEARDVAAEHPGVVAELVDVWETEAERNHVLPVIASFHRPLAEPSWPRPARVTYRPGAGRVANHVLPALEAGFTMWADVDVPDGGAEGVLCAMGDWISGLALFALGNRLSLALSVAGSVVQLRSDRPLPAGRSRVGCSYGPPADDLPARLALRHGEELVASTSLGALRLGEGWEHAVGALVIGRDEGFPVVEEYQPPFAWTGRLHTVTVETADTVDRSPTLSAALRED